MSHIPDCGVKLKGEDDVMVVADLADEATLGAQVAVVHVMGSKFNQGLEESFIHPLRNLWGQVQAFQAAVLRLWPSAQRGLLLPMEPCLRTRTLTEVSFHLGKKSPLNQAEQCRRPALVHPGDNRIDKTQTHCSLP